MDGESDVARVKGLEEGSPVASWLRMVGCVAWIWCEGLDKLDINCWGKPYRKSRNGVVYTFFTSPPVMIGEWEGDSPEDFGVPFFRQTHINIFHFVSLLLESDMIEPNDIDTTSLLKRTIEHLFELIFDVESFPAPVSGTTRHRISSPAPD